MHPTAIIATVAAGSVMTEGATANAWLQRSCHTSLRREKRRYYDNCLYFFCLILLSGCYQLESWA
jgi:oligosaccharide reducing-end xylanase